MTCHKLHLRRSKYCSPKCSDRAWQLKRKYGITPDTVFKMFKEQNGKCAICFTKGDVRELGFVKKSPLCVDHDHDTGAIRGLLCSPCNLGIGNLADDPEIISNAVKYLKKHKRKSSGKINKRRKAGRSKYPSGRK